MITRNAFLALALAAFTALTVTGGASFAQTAEEKATVDAAKARGEVGEQSDGFLGFVVTTVTPEVRAAVAEINAGRAEVYRQAAGRNNVSPAAAGVAAFETVIENRIQPGEYYRTPQGAWVRK